MIVGEEKSDQTLKICEFYTSLLLRYSAYEETDNTVLTRVP